MKIVLWRTNKPNSGFVHVGSNKSYTLCRHLDEDHWFKTNRLMTVTDKSILIPVWYFCCDYMAVSFVVISV